MLFASVTSYIHEARVTRTHSEPSNVLVLSAVLEQGGRAVAPRQGRASAIHRHSRVYRGYDRKELCPTDRHTPERRLPLLFPPAVPGWMGEAASRPPRTPPKYDKSSWFVLAGALGAAAVAPDGLTHGWGRAAATAAHPKHSMSPHQAPPHAEMGGTRALEAGAGGGQLSGVYSYANSMRCVSVQEAWGQGAIGSVHNHGTCPKIAGRHVPSQPRHAYPQSY